MSQPYRNLGHTFLQALQRSPELGAGPWLDLGTGSGAIAVGLASILPKACQVADTC